MSQSRFSNNKAANSNSTLDILTLYYIPEIQNLQLLFKKIISIPIGFDGKEHNVIIPNAKINSKTYIINENSGYVITFRFLYSAQVSLVPLLSQTLT